MATRISSASTKRSKNVHTLGAVSSTRNASFTAPGMSQKDGSKVIGILQERLAVLAELAMTLKHIHWNVVGPSFIAVHHMLDPQYAGVQEMVDTTAERIATLGGVPNGLPGNIVATRRWDDYELGRAEAQAHLAALDLVYSGVIRSHRQAIDETETPDPVTQDMLIGQTADLEQYQWFVRSHLEDYAGGLANAGATTELEAAQSAAVKTRRTRQSSRTAPGAATRR